jgi:hypothetical protein
MIAMLSGKLALGDLAGARFGGSSRWTKGLDLGTATQGKRHRWNLTTQIVVFCIWYDPDNFVDGGRIVRFLAGAQCLSDGFDAR